MSLFQDDRADAATIASSFSGEPYLPFAAFHISGGG
jgi:hypothetical protein